MDDVAKILPRLSQDYPQASEQLLPLVYEELRRLAAQRLANEASGQTLQPTALVHEAYLRLTGRDGSEPKWDGRGHFFAAAAEAMRRILVESARRKQRVKRGGGQQRISLEAAESLIQAPSEDLVAIDDALVRLTAHDPVKAEVVKLRFFAGLTMPQVALTLDISLATAERYWTYARTWLYAELSHVEPDNSRGKSGPA
jgi:RNA polymerase sigma factor (TIGR02999 family)